MKIMNCFGAKILHILVILVSIAYAEDGVKLFRTNLEVRMRSKCDEQSVIQKLWADATFPFQFTCSSNFRRHYFANWEFSISMANQNKTLSIPNNHWYIEWINGSYSVVSQGIIEKPDECAGDMFKDIGVFLSRSENDCYTTYGVSYLDAVGFNITIEGKCASTCKNNGGYIKIDPAINKDGPVPT